MNVSDYPLISDHGLSGDLQTSAFVTKDGTIDFFCAPRFDSPSVFASPVGLDAALNAGSGNVLPLGLPYRPRRPPEVGPAMART